MDTYNATTNRLRIPIIQHPTVAVWDTIVDFTPAKECTVYREYLMNETHHYCDDHSDGIRIIWTGEPKPKLSGWFIEVQDERTKKDVCNCNRDDSELLAQAQQVLQDSKKYHNAGNQLTISGNSAFSIFTGTTPSTEERLKNEIASKQKELDAIQAEKKFVQDRDELIKALASRLYYKQCPTCGRV